MDVDTEQDDKIPAVFCCFYNCFVDPSYQWGAGFGVQQRRSHPKNPPFHDDCPRNGTAGSWESPYLGNETSSNFLCSSRSLGKWSNLTDAHILSNGLVQPPMSIFRKKEKASSIHLQFWLQTSYLLSGGMYSLAWTAWTKAGTNHVSIQSYCKTSLRSVGLNIQHFCSSLEGFLEYSGKLRE